MDIHEVVERFERSVKTTADAEDAIHEAYLAGLTAMREAYEYSGGHEGLFFRELHKCYRSAMVLWGPGGTRTKT
jgi:hypothetical protein